MSSSEENNDGNNNTNIVILELTPKLDETGIVDKFVFNKKSNEIELSLNHVYDRTRVYVTVNKSWTKTVNDFLRELQHRKISEDHKMQLRIVLDNNHDAILFSNQQAGQGEEDDKTDAQKALELAEERIEQLFTDQFGIPHAVVDIDEHLETLPIQSSRFRNWLSMTHYEVSEDGQILGPEAITSAIGLLTAKAEFNGSTKILDLRVAKDPNDPYTTYYDLTNKDWEVVKVTPTGREILRGHDIPIVFRKQFRNQKPQVYPTEPNDYPKDIFDKFLSLFNLKAKDQDNNKLLLKCYIISLFYPDIPRPVLMLHGDSGSAKSAAQEMIRDVVDPSNLDTITLTRDNADMNQKIAHNYVCYFDNVSNIPEWISDLLCRAVTGSGNSKRQLYTDDEDIIYNFKRCIGFNGINLAATKPDLLDRGLIIELERIDDQNRRKIQDIKRELEAIKPQLLSYIFDILSKVLEVQSNGGIASELKQLPRMADFAEIGEIISRCMDYNKNEFIETYYNNIKLQTEAVIESNLVSSALVKLMEGYESEIWTGTITELLAELDENIAPILKINTNSKQWPKSPSALSRKINELRTNLRAIGIILDRKAVDSKTSTKVIEVRQMPKMPQCRKNAENHAQNASDISNGIYEKPPDNQMPQEMPIDKIAENHAQNESFDRHYGINGICKPFSDDKIINQENNTQEGNHNDKKEAKEKTGTDPPATEEGYWTKGHWRDNI